MVVRSSLQKLIHGHDNFSLENVYPKGLTGLYTTLKKKLLTFSFFQQKLKIKR
jgi:hypothetical protein